MKNFLSEGEPISKFQSQKPEETFYDAQKYPEFFENHLQDPNRIIKIFENDPHANERVFYYQYLRICEDFENPANQDRI